VNAQPLHFGNSAAQLRLAYASLPNICVYHSAERFELRAVIRRPNRRPQITRLIVLERRGAEVLVGYDNDEPYRTATAADLFGEWVRGYVHGESDACAREQAS
jgi:hypothetical protein